MYSEKFLKNSIERHLFSHHWTCLNPYHEKKLWALI